MKVQKNIHKLKGIQKQVTVLRIVYNKSYEEIAKKFGKTENWARQLFFRSKQQINEYIRESGEKDEEKIGMQNNG